MQTTVQSSRAVRLGSAVIAWNGVNIGALQNAKLKIDESVVSLVADNAKLPPRKKITAASIMADLWEINLDTLATLDGVGDLTSVAGSSTPVTNEVVKASGTWATNEVLFVAGKNANGAIASSITVKNGATTLVLGTDYALVLENGKTGIVRVGTGLATSGIGINVSYTYTPAASKTYTGKDVMKLIGMYSVEIYNLDENGKKLGITFPQGYNNSGIEWSFTPDEKLDEVMKMPIEIKAFPDASGVLFQIYDEQVYQ